MDGRYQLAGLTSSPYSIKLRAILRYRRLPFDWVLRFPPGEAAPPPVRPAMVPMLTFPEDGSLHVDSTPIAHALERRHPGLRSILPPDPAIAFLDALFEDMADEWLSKAVFHYRWSEAAGAEYASRWIASEVLPGAPAASAAAFAEAFARRQIGRMPLVGCTPDNAPVIEGAFRRVLALLSAHLDAGGACLFGTRPSLADFALLGQLGQLAADPASARVIRAAAPSVEHWLRRLDDASGVEGRWDDPETATSRPLVRGLAEMAADTYLPFLAANAAAASAGAAESETKLDGRIYRQGVFGYQVKCLAALSARRAALTDAERARLPAGLGLAQNL